MDAMISSLGNEESSHLGNSAVEAQGWLKEIVLIYNCFQALNHCKYKRHVGKYNVKFMRGVSSSDSNQCEIW